MLFLHFEELPGLLNKQSLHTQLGRWNDIVLYVIAYG
jgi:hypothetical protein